MKGALSAFNAEMGQLRSFLSRADGQEALLIALSEDTSHLHSDQKVSLAALVEGTTSDRRYRYFLSIIVMYGALERFVEDAVQEYVANLCSHCDAFADLPETIRQKHVSLSIEHLRLINDGRMADKSQIDMIVTAVASGFNGAWPFTLNAKAFTLRSANMTFGRTKDLFSNVGVVLIPKRLVSTSSFPARYQALYGEPPSTSGPALERMFDRIDELVDIRNNIAHGVIDTSQIEGSELINERIADLENFVVALVETLEQELLAFAVERGKSIPLGPLIQVFNNSIVCLELVAAQVRVGDSIGFRTGDAIEPVRFGRIASIQVDGEDLENVSGAPGLKVGMKVSFRAKAPAEYFLIGEPLSSQLGA